MWMCKVSFGLVKTKLQKSVAKLGPISTAGGAACTLCTFRKRLLSTLVK